MLIHWIAIGILILIALAMLKIEHHTRTIKIFLIIIIGAMLYFSIINVFSNSKIDISSPKGIVNGVYLYVGWIGQTASSLFDIGVNTTKMVGDAIKIDNSED